KMRVMADLPIYSPDAKQLLSPESLQQHMISFKRPDNVLFWNVAGGGLTAEDFPAVERAATSIQASDPRPIAMDIWDGFQPYSTSGKVKMLGVHRWPLMSSLELSGYREWLNERRGLAWPGTFMWTWIQDHLPDSYTNVVYEQPASQPF